MCERQEDYPGPDNQSPDTDGEPSQIKEVQALDLRSKKTRAIHRILMNKWKNHW